MVGSFVNPIDLLLTHLECRLDLRLRLDLPDVFTADGAVRVFALIRCVVAALEPRRVYVKVGDGCVGTAVMQKGW